MGDLDRLTDRLQQGPQQLFHQKVKEYQLLQKTIAKHHPAMKFELAQEKFNLLKHQLLQQTQIDLQGKSKEFAGKCSYFGCTKPIKYFT